MAVLDRHLADRDFLIGSDLTIADFSAAVTLPWADAARILLAGFAAVIRWHGRLMQLPAWRAPFPPRPAAAA